MDYPKLTPGYYTEDLQYLYAHIWLKVQFLTVDFKGV
jgi:hypothetical protein